MSTERWKPVRRFEGYYEVSSEGRVRSRDRACAARNGAVAIRKGRVLVPTRKNNGYFVVTLTKPGAREQIMLHILVLEAFRGPRPTGCPHTRHRDGGKSNNKLTNLRYGTVQQNADDRQRHGTALAGEAHPCVVLSAAQARRIKFSGSTAEARALALSFGVTASHGWAIHRGRAWSHLA